MLENNHMADQSGRSFQKLSDDEFYDYLKNRSEGNVWTLSELVEVERRGNNILDRDPNLKKEYEASKKIIFDSMRGAVQPLTDNIRQVGKALAQNSSLKSFELVSQTWKNDYSNLFKVDSSFLESLARRKLEAPWLVEDKRNKEIIHEFGERLEKVADEANNFDLLQLAAPLNYNQLEGPANDPKTIEAVKEPLLKKIQEGIGEDILAALQDITQNTYRTANGVRFGWQQWVILVASVIAAITGCISLWLQH